MKIKNDGTTIEFGFPPFKIGSRWVPDNNEREAAWKMLVEVVTRTAAVGQYDGEGSLREAMSSLYELFDITRAILKEAGSSAAPNKNNGNLSFGVIAVRMLNDVFRPFLDQWHQPLKTHEAQNAGKPTAVLEQEWPLYHDCLAALQDLRLTVRQYIDVLGAGAGTTEFAATVEADISQGPR